MDLRAIINNEAGENSSAKQTAPVTPVQVVPPQRVFREYSHPLQASPSRRHSQEYRDPLHPGGPTASPSLYRGSYPGRPSPIQSPLQNELRSPAGPFPAQARYRQGAAASVPSPPPPPPPIQAQLQNDSRSPATSYPAQSPYRPAAAESAPPTPIQAPPQHDLRSPAGAHSVQSPYKQSTVSSRSGAGQYPFPQVQTPQSPATHLLSYQRDSFPQSNPPPPHLQHHNSQSRASPVPQTPPIGIPGQPHSYLQHQRSQSSLSTSTPTSAQSQQPYFNQYPQDSPVAAAQYPHSQPPQNQRQQSQPGTPLGPPILKRHSSGGYNQPTSPYQQRATSSGPFANYTQTSPITAPPVPIPRLSSTPSASDSQRTSTSEPQRRSQSERGKSLSVSPKTRLPERAPGDVPYIKHPYPYKNSEKRNMEDRENPTEQFQRFEQHKVESNIIDDQDVSQPGPSSSQQPVRKRVRYARPPIWAQSVDNFNFASKRAMSKKDGKQPVGTHSHPQMTSAQDAKIQTNGRQSTPGATQRPGSASSLTHNLALDQPSELLGDWEESIENVKPADAIAKSVADWLYKLVVSRPDIGELSSRGVQVEIEAKLGQLINKDTGVRYSLPITTEAVLLESNRIGFRSSMTEQQHKYLNGYLNERVTETHPRNLEAQKGAPRRVPIGYIHRLEKDEFYELPPSYNQNLPPAVQQALKDRNLVRHPLKLRVSYDSKTRQLIDKIIKVRIGDLDILFPGDPLDCRISVNLEMHFEGSMEEIKSTVTENRQPDRLKNRVSYKQSHYQIDLTQVTQTVSVNGVNRIEKEHELEIELSTAELRKQGQAAAARQPHEYIALVEGFLNNVRLLTRKVEPR